MLSNFLLSLRSNPRLRWGLALIVGVLAVYGILLLRDQLSLAQQQHRALSQSITRLRSQAGQTVWLDRAIPAKTMAVQLEARLWQAPTAGLAQAALQDWVNAALVQSKATKPLVSVTVLDEPGAGAGNSLTPAAPGDGTAPTPSDLWKIKVKLGFDYSAASLLELLYRIENHDKRLIVEVLTVRKEPLAHVEMELLAYFQKPSPTDRPAETRKPVARPGVGAQPVQP